MAKIIVQERQVTIISHNENDYISLTDIAKYKSDDPTLRLLLETGCATETRLSFWASGKASIIPCLNPSNSRCLEKRLD